MQDGIELGEEKKKKKKESEKEKVTRVLKVLTGGKGASGSDSTGDGSDDGEALLKGGRHGDLMSRQRKLRKLSSEKPGTLLLRGFS